MQMGYAPPKKKKTLHAKKNYETTGVMICHWAVLGDGQISNGLSFFLLTNQQMSNKVGVDHQPDKVYWG